MLSFCMRLSYPARKERDLLARRYLQEIRISPSNFNRPKTKADLADYWDILLISKRTEAVGG